MKDKTFVDSNLWIYLYDEKEGVKQRRIEKLIIDNFNSIIISTQVLNEMYNILYKKIKIEQSEIKAIIVETVSNFEVASINVTDVLRAIEIKNKYSYSYWDSLIIASAIENGCTVLYSEDMQNNQLIESKLKIVNPF